jgi:tetraacyldisaccharide 4'-kinase
MKIQNLLAGVFGAGVAFRNQLYDSRRLRVNELRGPVVSIGNISVGGSGKTPFTILLGTLLKQRGISFDILSRGYRRRTTGVMVVDPNGSSLDFGDEPLLMARELGVDVIVGEDRYQAGLLAEKTWGPRLHLLDDAFQHRRLARQFDIVLLSPEDLDDVLLPAGRLREPLSSLSRADAVVITGDTPTNKLPPHLRIWRINRELYLAGAPSSPFVGKGGIVDAVHPVAFCGIAKPQNFFRQLYEKGMGPVAEIAFRDHHRYTPVDIRRLRRIAELRGADSFVTTAKDAINLEGVWEPVMWGGHSSPPLVIAKLDLTLDNADLAINTLLTTLAQRGKPAS